MDLTFYTNKMTYLSKIFAEVRHQEETAETVVPDSYPDAASVADCFASVMLRGKEFQNGTAVISGAVKAGVIYHPEDNSYPRLMEFYLPFSVSFDSPALTETSQIAAELKIASADARIINSRKILLRVNISCDIAAYITQEFDVHQLQTKDERLQLKQQTFRANVPAEMEERTFVINEILNLQPGQPPISQIYKTRCNCRVTDKKLVGNKAVFKGTLQCRMLYRGENDILYTHSAIVPFSQYCELDRDYDEGTLSISVVFTGCDVSTDHEGVPALTANLLVQCLVYSPWETELVEDAYCVGADLTSQWQHNLIACRLDSKSEQLSVRHPIPGTMSEIIDTEIYDDFPLYKQCGDTMKIIIPIHVRVFGMDDHHAATSRQVRAEISLEYPLADNAECHVRINSFDGCMVHTVQDALDFQCTSQADVCFTAVQELATLCGGCINENSTAESRVPSMILRAISEEQPLWDVAKAYKTTVTALRRANEIDADYTPDHGMLLIPIS